MVKWISFAIQLLALKKTFTQSTSAMEYVERSAQTARSYFLFTIGCIIASLFLLISLVVAIIGVGLQIENSGTISFTGLMISAVLFLVISVFFYILSAIALIMQKQRLSERRRLAEQAKASASGVSHLFEEILKQILNNLSTPKHPASASEKSTRSEKPEKYS